MAISPIERMAAVAWLCLLCACNGPPSPHQDAEAATSTHGVMQMGSSCVQDVRITFPSGHGIRSIDQVPLAGRLTDIPEFHDCQRMLIATPIPSKLARLVSWVGYEPAARWHYGYGPMIAIFVSERIDSVAGDARRSLQPLRDPKSFRTPAPANDVDLGQDADPTPTSPLSVPITVGRPAPPGQGAVPVIQIFNFSGQIYLPLGIGPRFNCAYLNENMTRAWVIWMDTIPDCPSPISESQILQLRTAKPGIVKQLHVRRDYSHSAVDADYPPVARWDWDPVAMKQYFAVKCGAAWCEIGPANFTASAKQTPGTAHGKRARVWNIKGWHDSQRLAGPTGAVSDLQGTVIPDTLLGERRIEDFTNKWIPAAEVHLNGQDPTYKSKFNFDRALPGERPNVIELMHDTMLPDTGWKARVTAADQSVVERKVKRCTHHHVIIPGAVRWRYVQNDETVWMKCAEGCCEIQPFN